MQAETKGTEIRTVEELRNIANNMAGSYQLMQDIDLSGVDWYSINQNSGPAKFSGTLDGNGYAIKNLSGHTTFDKRSIFYELKYATIKNLEFENINLSVGSGFQGGVLAHKASDSTIDNISVTGYLDTSADTGLFYSINRCKISNIFMDLTSDKGSSSIYSYYNDLYQASTLNNAIVINSGIKSTSLLTAQNSFYYTTLTGSFAGTALTLETMKDINTFVGFDFDNIWYMDEKAGHPKLRISQ